MFKKIRAFFFFIVPLFGMPTWAGFASVSPPIIGDGKLAQEDLLNFKYDQKELKDILNSFAEKKGINIIYSEADPLTAQVTFDAGRKVTLSTAWEFVIMLLDKAGFSLLPRGNKTCILVANSSLANEPLPLYFDTYYHDLPDTQEKIRYVFYFNNILLSSQQASLDAIFKTVFPSSTYSQNVIYDTKNNGVIFSGSSQLIKSIMPLIEAFDEPGYTEHIEIMTLKFAGAADVVTILNSLLQNDTTPKRGYVSKKSSTKQATYFETGTKVLNLDPNNIRKINSLIVFGKEHEVKKVIDFIKKHIDVPQDDGSPFYHVVELQHISSSDVATQLQSLVTSGASLSSQSTGSLSSELAFDSQTKIIAESVSTGTSSNTKNQVQRGGNRVIIAANNRDWKRLKGLIDDLDKPQKQVVVEALILDLSLDFTQQLSSQIRTRGLAPSIFPKYMQAQAGLITKSQVISGATDYTALTKDLSNLLAVGTGLSFNDTVSGSASAPIGSPTATSAFQNSTVFMFDGGTNANGVWSFFQLLSQHTSVKVVTRPFTIARNNQTTTISSTETQYLPSSVTAGTAATVSLTAQTAPVSISFTPLISDNGTINLQNDISVTYWNISTDVQSATQKFTRTLTNNVSLKSGDVLVVGGLTRTRVGRTLAEVPVLSKIPIIGNLFSGKSETMAKDQLFVIMRPTIIEPRTQGGMGNVTLAAARTVKSQILDSESVFSGLKDPVNRYLFESTETSEELVDQMLIEMDSTREYGASNLHDTKYKKKIVQIGEKKEKLKKREEKLQQSSNLLQYQLHNANNPYKNKTFKKSSKKKKRRRKKSTS